MIVGRSQGPEVAQLLPTHDIVCSEAFKHSLDSAEINLPNLNMRYDVTRFTIVTYFYDLGFNALDDILWSLVEAAMPVALEYYYPDAKPDIYGNCPNCDQKRPQ